MAYLGEDDAPRLERGVQICSALGDSTRMRILNLLATRELCVSDVGAILVLTQPRASWHLKILRLAGLVRARRQGQFMRYRLARHGWASRIARRVLSGVHGDPQLAADRNAATDHNATTDRDAAVAGDSAHAAS